MSKNTGKVAIVTGASSGIGKEAAKALAQQGWRVIGTGRDSARMAAAKSEIQAAIPEADIELLPANLSLMAEVVRLAETLATLTDHVDVLINNAGGMTDKLEITEEGLEANFAVNHLAPFLLTHRLLPLLREAAQATPDGPARILMTASDASEMLPAINLDDMQNLAAFDPGLAYCTGKLANVLFTRALADRLDASEIVVHSVAPGAVASNFYSYAPAETQEHVRNIAMKSPEEGADTLVWLSTDDEPARSTGGYWEDRKPRAPNPVAEDPAIVERFWQESEKLVGSWMLD